MGFKQGNGGQLSYRNRIGRAVILRPEPPVFDEARVAAKAAPTKRRWLMSPNARRGAEATFSLIARSVQAGQRPVFCKEGLQSQTSILDDAMVAAKAAPTPTKRWFLWEGLSPRTPSSMRQGSRRKTLPYHHASRIDLALPSLSHRFTQSHGRLSNGIPISDHWKGRAKTVSVGGAFAPNPRLR
jgi:hypothetical protein